MFCGVKARKGDRYYTGVELRPSICGACIDGIFHELRAADWRIWLNRDPPEDFDPRDTLGGYIEIRIQARRLGKPPPDERSRP
jgi:hypothetical protein